jgi:hypothetical protein
MPIQDDDAPTPANALSRDRRRTEMAPWEADPPMAQQTQQIDLQIEQAHCRLLERATNGRLTWYGDEIVRKSPPQKRLAVGSSPTISKLLDKPLVRSTLK